MNVGKTSWLFPRPATKEAFVDGIRDTAPFMVLFAFYYVTFGMLSATSGIGLLQSLSMTVLIFSTPLQFLLVQNHADGLLLVPLVLALNARFALMATALLPYLRQTRLLPLAVFSILIVPSVFALCISRYKSKGFGEFFYLIGTGVPLFAVACVANVIGYAIGSVTTSSLVGLTASFVLALQFSVLAAKLLPRYPEVWSFAFGIIFGPAAVTLFGGLSLVLAPFVVAAFVLLISRVRQSWQP